ncbi:hypothetical protein Ciccas_014299, partial [Cichlidogyrus casuarinus]
TDDTLYFNAILAPKESRAKWRATQVWRECDKKHFGRMEGNVTGSGRVRNNFDLEETSLANFSTSSICDETEFEGEMDELDMTMPTFEEYSSLNDYNETLISGLSRNMKLTDADLKKLSSDLADEMNRFYDETLAFYTDNEDSRRKYHVNEFLTVTSEEIWALGDDEDLSSSSNSFHDPPFSSKVTSSSTVELAPSTTRSLASVGVQTLSTGEIMTKQFYHEDDAQ